MAPRSSLYSSALQIPEWVYGGEFGDLSKVMNARDIDYERVAQSEQQTEENEINLEAKRRKERMRDILNERAGQSRPATIREAYEQMINAAYESGDPVAAMELEGKKQDYEQAQLTKKRAEVTGAIGLADNVDFNRIEELYPGVLTKSDYDKNQRRKRGEGEEEKKKDEKMVTLFGPDGTPEMIPQSRYNEMVRAGYIDPKLDERDPRQIKADYERKVRESLGEDESDSFLIPWGKPSPSPTPTAAQAEPKQDGKGDRARQLPSVKDQVKTIKRKREV